ncbi:DUF4139 domain-containing protein [Candidatus Desantisbacteria bacterium]|nr:DUF4139 domain-containing protein [Candidatus Desantisbacteria bacterium]
MKRFLLLSILLFSVTVAYAQPDRGIDITIYSQDLAMVKEVRPLKAKQGAGLITLSDLPAQLDPSSISISPVSVLQQSYEYDLSDFSKLLANCVNGTVSVSLQNGKIFEGCLLSYDQQWIFLRNNIRIELIAISEIANISLPNQMDGLLTTPTIVCRISGDTVLPQLLTLRYLTSGISWKCDYTAVINGNDTAIELSAKATIDNQSGGKFPQARIKLVAGNPFRIQDIPVQRYEIKRMMAAAPLSEAEGGYTNQENLGEYYLYTIKTPATLNNNQTTQLGFFPQKDVTVKRTFNYDYTKSAKNARLMLSFKNENQSGLGSPLPKGKIRFYKQDEEGFLQFVGENIMEHTPVDKDVTLCLGDAFDVTAKREIKDRRVLSKEIVEEDYEIKILNSKKEKITVEVVEHTWGTWNVIRSTHKSVKKSVDTLLFEVEVLPGKEETLAYTVSYRR